MKKVLVVDDEKDIREVIRNNLEKNGYIARAAANGAEAVEICKLGGFDLVIMDIVMPQLNGYEACEKLKENATTRNVPVLLLTAKDLDTKGISKHYEELDVAGYLAKPSTIQELLDKVRSIIG
ncbi:MAG: response regulator [Deltaproteobacteria bacterium]